MITRPPMRYHGGKWKLAPWIIAHLPAHRVYCESFGGAASVLLRKPAPMPGIQRPKRRCCEPDALPARGRATARGLAAAVQWTPYSRAEFDATYEPTDDPIERARRTLLQTNAATVQRTNRRAAQGFRSDTSRAGTIPRTIGARPARTTGDWRALAGAW